MTPLLRAARGGDDEAVDLLLKAGALVDLPLDREWRDQIGGMTPLMVASGLGTQINDTRGKLDHPGPGGEDGQAPARGPAPTSTPATTGATPP